MFAKQREYIGELYNSTFVLCEKRQRAFMANHPESTMIHIPKENMEPGKFYIKYTVDCGPNRREYYGEFNSQVGKDWFKATTNCKFSPVNESGDYYMRIFTGEGAGSCMVRATLILNTEKN